VRLFSNLRGMKVRSEDKHVYMYILVHLRSSASIALRSLNPLGAVCLCNRGFRSDMTWVCDLMC